MSHRILALILGDEPGHCLYPLTEKRSKPAVPIGGKYRLVDIPISNCLNAGIGRMFVLTQFNSSSLNRHIKNTYHFSAFSMAFVDILAAEQTPTNTEWFKGTADAIRKNLHRLKTIPCEFILVIAGDQVNRMNYCDMMDKHIQLNADITIATVQVSKSGSESLTLFDADEKGYIWKVKDAGSINKEAYEEMNMASMGIYIFNKKVLFNILENEQFTASDLAGEIIPNCMGRYKIASYAYDGFWANISSIHNYLKINLDLVKEHASLNLFEKENTLFTHIRLLPPAKINGATMVNAVISEGSIIDSSYIENAVIGNRSRIASNSRIINTYIMGNDYYEKIGPSNTFDNMPLMGVGKNCFIKNAIIDMNVRIGNDVYIEGHENLPDAIHDLYVIKDGIVIVKMGVTLPDGFRIGLSS